MNSTIDDADYCPTCGQPRDRCEVTERFGLKLVSGNMLSFQGRSVRLNRGQAEFIRAMLEKGRASREFLVLRIAPECESNIVHVYACQVRKRLEALTGGRITIFTIWGWGYELTCPDDALALAA